MKLRWGWAALIVVGLVGLPTWAQDKKPDEKKPAPQQGDKKPAEPQQGDKKPADKKPEAQPPAGGQPSEAEKAMMEAYKKIAAPGPHHDQLKPLAGKWEIAGKFRMDAAAPWTETKSKSANEWILGGRFLTQKVNGDPMMPGEPPFEGFGILGFDNQSQKFVSTWMDNMGTMIMTAEGTGDAAGKVITFKGDYVDPMTNQKTWMKTVYKIESNDKYMIEMYGPDQAGKEFLVMELTHTRAK